MIPRLFLLAVIALFAGEARAQSTAPPPDAPLKRNGQQIFVENCSRCHGPDGSSNTFIGHRWHIPDLRSEPVQKLSIEQRITIITHGKNNMPAHEKRLTADEIKLVEGYVRELGKPASPATR